MINNAYELFLTRYPEYEKKRRGLPFPGKRPDGKDFFPDTKLIDDTFTFSNGLYSYEDIIDKRLKPFNAGAGSPLRYKPFPLAAEALQSVSTSDELSQYQLAAGDLECRVSIAEAMESEGFGFGEEKKIGPDNIIFTNSTTEAFDYIVKLIARPYDAVIFTGPTYGLFVYIPERNNAISVIMPLFECEGWIASPERLERTIKETNTKLECLKTDYKLSYQPQVVAFVNINPSNPTGKVMGQEYKSLLTDLHDVCKRHGVWIIDDIIYQEITYNPLNKPLALASIDCIKDNIITIIGPSKCYGLAGARAGMVIADDLIIRGIRPIIFQHMDSTSLCIGKVLQACYSKGGRHNREYEHYFSCLNAEYKRKSQLMRLLVEGVKNIPEKDKEHLIQIVKDASPDSWEELITPIEDIRVAGNIIPESGFFMMLDFSASVGKHYKDITIKTDSDIMYFYYINAYVKMLMGKSIAWPRNNEIVSRVSFAIDDRDIVIMIKQMKDAAKLLKRG